MARPGNNKPELFPIERRVDGVAQMRGPGESYSDVILRLAEA